MSAGNRLLNLCSDKNLVRNAHYFLSYFVHLQLVFDVNQDMEKRFSAVVITAMLCLTMVGQGLKFHNGTFKIVQFTDLHYKTNTPASDAALACMDEIINQEMPDLIVVTGDIIYSKPGNEALQEVLDCLSAHKRPFVMTFGNHDGEQGVPLTALYDQMRKVPYNIQPDRNVTKTMDYVLPIKSSSGTRTAALVYCFDSHNRSGMPGVNGYQWLTFDQIGWYRRQSATYRSQNSGRPLPALAFFHIPLPEFNMAVDNPQCILYGTRMERAYTPNLNSGMFTAMKECGDVMGIFCGHDHDNDYSVIYYDVLLAHGRFSGGNTEYNHLRNGARVIILKEGKRSFDTYIRERGGRLLNSTTYPNSYVKDNWKTRKGELAP